MTLLNRDSSVHAQQLIESFLPDPTIRRSFVNFLVEAISFADNIDPGNWSLNLDTKGRFLRFNTGQVYCIDLYPFETLILCNKATLSQSTIPENVFYFQGKSNNEFNWQNSPDKQPDLLAKVRNSVGALISNEQIADYIHLLKIPNEDFIRAAVKTRILPNMRQAHSQGAVDYIFSLYESKEENELSVVDYSTFLNITAGQLAEAQDLSPEERRKALQFINPIPAKIIVQQTVYVRDPLVTAERLYLANGICDHCGKPAPFNRDSDGTPYLEVHHIKMLAEGGEDTLENTVALCPNCHRKAHYGKAEKE